MEIDLEAQLKKLNPKLPIIPPGLKRVNSLPNLKKTEPAKKHVLQSAFKRADSISKKIKEDTKVYTPTRKAKMTKRLSIKKFPLNMSGEMYYWLRDSLEFLNLFQESPNIKAPKTAILKETYKNKTLFLDLDHTLISNISDLSLGFSKFLAEQTEIMKIPFVRRPYLQEFLVEVDKHYEIQIFTTAKRKYAEDILNIIEPTKTLIKGILSEENCSVLIKDGKNYLFKHLDCVPQREKKDTVIIDDNIRSWPCDLENFIPIPGFYGDPNETQLPKLASYLTIIAQAPDLREALKEKYPIQKYVTYLQKNEL